MDKAKVKQVLNVWFADAARDEYDVDSRMKRWFDADEAFDAELKNKFESLCDDATFDRLDDCGRQPAWPARLDPAARYVSATHLSRHAAGVPR